MPPIVTAGGIAFSGAFTGTMLNPSVVCEQHLREGDSGFMSATGMVGGKRRIVTIWSAGAHQPEEIYEGPDAGAIDYGQVGGGVSGIPAFDWAHGATIDAVLPAVAPTTGASLRVSGTIVCP